MILFECDGLLKPQKLITIMIIHRVGWKNLAGAWEVRALMGVCPDRGSRFFTGCRERNEG